MKRTDLPRPILDVIRRGTVIPATPLALNSKRQFDERRQRALMRYYIDAGVGGIAVGMHFTQFEIRTPGIDLFDPIFKAFRVEGSHVPGQDVMDEGADCFALLLGPGMHQDHASG